MKLFYLLRCTIARLFIVSILSLSCLPALAGPIQPGESLLVDPQLQTCLDEALLTNGWTTTEEVTSLSCLNRNIVFLDGIQIFSNLAELNLAGNQIFSTWPLDQLQQLEVLDLSDNKLLDVYSLQIFHNLTQLNLSGNKQLPALDVQNIIQNNPWLTHIGVADIAMGDLSWLPLVGPQGEYNLVELDISNTGSFVDLTPLTQYPNLRVLKAAGNQVQFSIQLEQLQQLEVLDLSDNQLLDVYPLQMLHNLTQLNLSRNKQLPALDVQNIIQNNPWLTHIGVADISMGDLSWLPLVGSQGEYNLVELDISNTGSFVDLTPLTQYPNLRVLKAAGNQVQFSIQLEQLQQLEVLNLSDNKLLDVYSLQMFHSLTQLSLSGNNQLPALDVQNIIQNNPWLTHIGVADIAMGDLNWLPPMGPQGEYNLLELDISNTGSFVDLTPLAQYPNLRVLKAAGNQLPFPSSIDQLQQLEVLDLSDNKLVYVYSLQMLHNLTQLNLSGNSQLPALDVQNIIQNNPWLTHIGVAGIAMGDLNWLPPMGFPGEYNLIELDISNTGSFVDLTPLTQYPNLRVLKAAGNQLQYPFPLDQLQQLEVLDLSDNQLLDVYPLQVLHNLTQLSLSGNSQLPALDVQNIIQNNPGLTHIGVAGIAMGDLNWLPPMGFPGEYNLIELDISNTGSFVDLTPLTQYPNLRVLKAAGNQLQYPFPLDQLQQLEVLDLSDNQLLDVYPLQVLHNLTQLNLSGNSQLPALDVQNIIQNNPGLTHIGVAGIAMGDLNWLPPTGFLVGPTGEYNLVELDISNTGSFVDLYPLMQYPNLRVLKAAGNQLQYPFPLDQLQQLEVLDLSDNQLLDVYPLQVLHNLTQLNLSGNNQLPELDVQNIIQNNPGLTHIGVAGIAMGDLNWLPPMGFQGEYNLIELDISNTGSFVDLYPLMQYPNLRVLKAAGNQVQYPFPLEQLLQLEMLDLSNNDLQSVLPLANLVRLTSLDLRGNNNIPCNELDALEAQLLPGVLLRPQSCLYLSPPVVTILSPSNTGLYFQTDSINFVASANDVEDGNLDVFVQWSSNIDGELGIGASLSSFISAGEHVITATVVDSHGNTSSTSVNLSVQQNTAPHLNILSIQDSEIFNESEVVLLAADANDVEEGDISANIQWTSSLDGSLGTGSSIQPLLSVGTHVITASITDGAGATVIQTVTVTINALPTLTLQSPLSGALYMLQETVELRAIAKDLEDADISANVQWSSDIDGLLGTGAVLMKTLSLGTHTVTTSITDSNGGTYLLTTQLVIDQIDLGITVSGKGRKRTATLSWSGSRIPVDIYKDGVIVGTAENTGTMRYRFKDQASFKVCETGTNYCSVEILVQ